MKLSIPFNGQPDLLEKIDKEKVAEIYGKLTNDFIGGGRPSSTNPYISINKIAACVKETHRLGIEFNYLLNASCLGNREWTRSGQKKIRKLLDWLTKIEVDTITVASPYLAKIIKKCYSFKITTSAIAQINSLKRAKMWEELGVDEIVLCDIGSNRNFPLLRIIRKEVKCRIKVIANEDCLFHCLRYFYHANVTAHASQNVLGNYYINYCRVSCRLRRILEPVNFIRAAWIRPEDTHYYKAIGVDRLKLIDRGMTTEALIRVIKAYQDCRYDGNLLDLSPKPSTNLVGKNTGFINKLRYFFRPFYINIFKLYKIRNVTDDFDVYIDNRALDGFIEFFLKDNCELKSCGECGYCEDVARRSVRINLASQKRMSQLHRDFLAGMVSGDIFSYKSKKGVNIGKKGK
ncbi:MAG: U32 family peptidase [Candidatus Omnitrophica bacterium]|nr:U32 family peptidase [Candidatus Omnitrophota bacterium]